MLIEAELDVSVSGLYGRNGPAGDDRSDVRRLCEYWTLSQDADGPWMVEEIEERAQGDPHLSEPIAA